MGLWFSPGLMTFPLAIRVFGPPYSTAIQLSLSVAFFSFNSIFLGVVIVADWSGSISCSNYNSILSFPESYSKVAVVFVKVTVVRDGTSGSETKKETKIWVLF